MVKVNPRYGFLLVKRIGMTAVVAAVPVRSQFTGVTAAAPNRVPASCTQSIA